MRSIDRDVVAEHDGYRRYQLTNHRIAKVANHCVNKPNTPEERQKRRLKSK